MPASLMASQFATLEAPGEDEGTIVLSVEPLPEVIVDMACLALQL
jgi:gluconate kinase